MAADNKARIREFINRSFRNVELADDQDIFELGFINSLFAMQLVLFVEKEFGVHLEDGDLTIDNFRTITAISSLIEQKIAFQAAAQ
ncbi:MAG TPA: acyl carrier protein [Ktedonobacteraceae bacterium]|nr:acyl carrier protein [Ktedonobacteraceae bacterium]